MEITSETRAQRSYTTVDRALLTLLGGDVGFLDRFHRVKSLARKVRSTEYLLTNACNIRCEGCWFFKHDFDKTTSELKSVEAVREFAKSERERGITNAIIIGREANSTQDSGAAYAEL